MKERYENALEKLNTKQDIETPWREMNLLAEQGYEPAMEFVALSYYRGDYIAMDEPLALEWFHKIVKQFPTNSKIWRKIADCYFYGYGVVKNHNTALVYYTKAWENGNVDAGADIGWIHSFGDIDSHNDMTAAKWFQRASDKGSIHATYFMGYFYAEGYGGLPVSEKMASKYLHIAAEQDDMSAIRYLLRKKCYGNDVEFLNLRNRLIEMADNGDDSAQNIIAYAYLWGEDWDSAFGLEKNPDKAKYYFNLSAKQGNIDSTYELGKAYLDYESGFGYDSDLGEKYLLEASEKGKEDACYELYRLYKWTKPDEKKSLYWAERTVENGSDFLNSDIAKCYFEGIGTETNYSKAAYYFKKCIKDDMDDVQSNLSYLPLAKCLILDASLGTEKYKDVHIYLNMAQDVATMKDYCSEQLAEIEYWLGYLYDNGLGTQINIEAAYMHYLKSSEKGNSNAADALKHFKKSIFGWKKYNGGMFMGMSNYQILSDQSLELINSGRWDEAFDDLKKRQADKDKDGIAVLAQFYLYGIGVAKDNELAIELFEQAINLGSAEAAWELGVLYHHNEEGIPTNKYKAFELFEQGAKLGNENCFGALSECYLRGEGTSVNEQKAIENALIAAKAGNATGMINAAICYDDGLGINPDPYAACHWYKEYLNYEPDDDFVMLRIALCLADPYERYGMRATGDMLNEAFYYASKALEKGNVEAHLIVGWFYEKGEVVQQDFDLAHKYIEIAANNGDEVAIEHLKVFRKSIYGTYYIP